MSLRSANSSPFSHIQIPRCGGPHEITDEAVMGGGGKFVSFAFVLLLLHLLLGLCDLVS